MKVRSVLLRQLCSELGADVHDHTHTEGSRSVIYVQEFHRYLVVEEDDRQWWTNDLLQVWPELVPTDQLAVYVARFAPHKGSGSCAPWCSGPIRRKQAGEYDLGRADVADDGGDSSR